MSYQKPSEDEILAASGKTLPDIIAFGLDVLFCGINPGLYSGAVGHHFARPGNRFWPTLYAAGFTNRLLTCFEERELLELGYGITNIVDRATRSASELLPRELIEGRQHLEKKVRHYNPKCIAFLGIGAYRTTFGKPKAVLGMQNEMIGESVVYVLPNPSGLNAHYPPKDLKELFRGLLQTIKSR